MDYNILFRVDCAVIATFLLFPSASATGNVALLIIDVQNCFLPGGSLAVTGGDEIIPVINAIRANYNEKIALTVLTQDWHCPDHVSFASEHPGKNPMDVITLNYDSHGALCSDPHCDVTYSLNQTMWPVHCVYNTTSAKFNDALTRKENEVIVKKGYNCEVDSYSGFFDNGGFGQTELHSVLVQHNIDTVLVTGLAMDYCVYYTSKDAKTLGYETYLVQDASRPVAQSTADAALQDLRNKGIHLIQSSELEEIFDVINSGPCIDCLSVRHVLLCTLTTIVYMRT